MVTSSHTDHNQTPNAIMYVLAVGLWEISSIVARETTQIVS